MGFSQLLNTATGIRIGSQIQRNANVFSITQHHLCAMTIDKGGMPLRSLHRP